MQHTSAMEPVATPKALPSDSIMLHIGAHKTGTTSVQAALYEAREALAAQGVFNLVPVGAETANIAARAVQRLPASGTYGSPVDYTIWEQLVASSAKHRGSQVAISAEAFATAEPAVIDNIVRDLGRDRLHVVVTLRPLAKILPSQWQQDLHGAWQSSAFDTWLNEVLKDPRPSRRLGPINVPHRFWYRHRHDELVFRWERILGPERISLVVVDDQRSESLFETFEQLLGIRDGTLPRSVSTRNRSMTLPEMLIMQRYGELLASSEMGRRVVEHARYHRALRILRKIRPENTRDARLQIPSWAHAPVGEIQESMRSRLASVGANLVGSLDRLGWLPGRDPDGEMEGNTVRAVTPDELELITQRMLKSAARRVGVVQEETGAVVVSRPSRALRALSWAIGRAGRVMRLVTRFIRLRF
jgi:hypothetical protein